MLIVPLIKEGEDFGNTIKRKICVCVWIKLIKHVVKWKTLIQMWDVTTTYKEVSQTTQVNSQARLNSISHDDMINKTSYGWTRNQGPAKPAKKNI